MKKQTNLGMRKVLVMLIVYLSVILAALLIVAFPRIAPLVSGVVIALSVIRLAVLFGWGMAKNGWRYYL